MAIQLRWRVLTTVIGFIIAVGICALPFLSSAVFFPPGQYTLDVILGAILATLCGFFAFHKRFRAWVLKDEHLHYGDLAVLLLVLLYIVAIFYAADSNLAVTGALNYTILLLPYFVLRLRSLRHLIGPWIGIGFAGASFVVNVIGIPNGWGQFHTPFATETNPQGQIQIASLFQYHNSYGAFVASIAVALLVWSARTTCTWWKRAAALMVAGLNIAGVFASESRGVLAIWAVVMIFTAIGMREFKESPTAVRNRFIGDSYIAIVGGLAGYELVHHAITHHSATSGWVGILVSIIVPGLIAYLRHLCRRQIGRMSVKTGLIALIAVGVLVAVLGALAKHHAIAQKLSAYKVHQLSVSQRFIFWRDGLHILARNPVTGSGYGAWEAMYMRVQSYPYYSNQSHSFGVDTLINVGILGALCMIALVWPMFRNMIWPPRHNAPSRPPLVYAFIAGGWMAFCHSLMDWDMAFLFLLVLFFAGAGAASALTPPVRLLSTRRGWQLGFSLGIGAVSIAACLVSIGGVISTRLANLASEESPVAALGTYRSAFAWAPYNGNYLANAASALLQTGDTAQNQQTAEQWMEEAEARSPYSSSFAANYAQLAYNLSNFKTAYKQAKLAEKNAPYWPNNMSLALSAGVVYGLQTAAEDPFSAKAALIDVVHLYNQALMYQRHVNALPSYLPPSVPYQLNGFSIVSVAAADYLLGDPAAAAQLAATQINSNVQHTQETAIIVQMLATDNPNLPNFVKAHPDIQPSYQLLRTAQQYIGK